MTNRVIITKVINIDFIISGI